MCKFKAQGTRSKDFRKAFRDVKYDLTKTTAMKTWIVEVGEQKGRRQSDSQWKRNTYTFSLRLVGFLVIIFLEAGIGTRCALLFVDASGGRGGRDPLFNGCDTGSGLFDFCLQSIAYSRWMMGSGAVGRTASGWEEYPGYVKRRGATFTNDQYSRNISASRAAWRLAAAH